MKLILEGSPEGTTFGMSSVVKLRLRYEFDVLHPEIEQDHTTWMICEVI